MGRLVRRYIRAYKLTVRAGGIKFGTFGSPISFAGDEWAEWHGQVVSGESKPMVRIRCSNEEAMTSGIIEALQVQAYSQSGYNVYSICALLAEAGLKGSETLNTSGYLCAIKATVEDDGDSPTYAGRVCAIDIMAQIGANPTGDYVAININCGNAAGGTNTPFDAVIGFFTSAGQNAQIAALIKTAATLGDWGSTSTKMISSGTLTDSGAGDVACDARMRINIGGVSYWIPLFDTAP